jgi:murein DD-endopeptidase MepM/ murein hydrolase activator NlpD
LDTGDAVYAAFDGVVRVDMPTRMSGGYGNVIVIRHVNGLETYYGHLSKRLVKSGDIVKAGELIGYGGSTGRSTGPHLHFETRYMGQSFDPERIFDFERGTLRSEEFLLKKHYFSINSHYGQTDQQSLAASKKTPKDTASSSKKVYYKVRKGDNLGKIAKKHGTTVSKICKLNGIRANKVLKVGQTIRVK